MKKRMSLKWSLLAFSLSLGCTGTDYINDPIPTFPPRLEISSDVLAVEVGDAVPFQAAFFDESGSQVEDTQIVWSSSEPEIATVDEQGLVRGLQAGQVHIVATVDGLADSLLVGIVVGDDIAAIVIPDESPSSLSLGEAHTFSAQSQLVDGSAKEDVEYTWHSSDPSVIQIDDSGQATALAIGSATIHAEGEGIVSNSVVVTVLGLSRTGQFEDASESVEGTVTLREGESGVLVLELGDDFLVQDAPALDVFLSTSKRFTPSSINLGRLQEFAGAQSYEVPDTIELDSFDFVVIHCLPFSVTFGFAELE